MNAQDQPSPQHSPTYNPLAILPWLVSQLEKLSIQAAGPGAGKLPFWIGTLGIAPAGLYLWKRKIRHPFTRFLVRTMGWFLLLGITLLFFQPEETSAQPPPRVSQEVLIFFKWWCFYWLGRWIWHNSPKNRFFCFLTRTLACCILLFALGNFFDALPTSLCAIWVLCAHLGRLIHWTVILARRITSKDVKPLPPPEPVKTPSLPIISEPGRFGLTRLDRASLGFIAAILICFAIGHKTLMTHFATSDSWYHMAVARQIVENDMKVPLWDTWEYQYAELDPTKTPKHPPGRPHLYPPAIHYMNAILAFGSVERIPGAYNFLQVIMYPLALLFSWYFMRWLQDDVVAFLGLLILSMEMAFNFSFFMLIPSGIVMAIFPVWLMVFIKRKLFPAILLTAFSLYLHPGLPPILILGFGIFAITDRQYLPFYWRMTLGGLLLYTPWITHTLQWRSWLHTPTEFFIQKAGLPDTLLMQFLLGFLLLQIINPFFIFLGIRGWIKKSDPRHRVVKIFLIAFLPLLVLYGGRYFMHTAQFWAVLIALNFTRFIAFKQTRKRIAFFFCATLLPLPIIFIGMPGKKPFVPFPFVSITGSHVGLLAIFNDQESPDNHKGVQDLMRLIKDHTEEGELIHVDTEGEGMYLADRIVVYTGRIVDTGGWAPEVRSQEMEHKIVEWRNQNQDCLFVYFKEHAKEMPEVDQQFDLGDFTIGVRGKHEHDFSAYIDP